MKQYLLSVYHVEGEPTPAPEAIQEIFKAVDAVNQEIRDAGAWVFAGGLYPHTSATVVNAKNGEVLMTDGPFPEGKEHIGGFWVIQAKDLDEALAWASKATLACQGPVEVRPFEDEPEA
ncbi:MAG: hypothetical protein QOK05_1986 [Chloroflexota bacterium]|jgi:hypothetical protein|nr:hypothetical protein [Chloroflexota bacterium]